MGHFPRSREDKYILLVVDYVSKWIEAVVNPTNNARVVTKFFKRWCSLDLACQES